MIVLQSIAVTEVVRTPGEALSGGPVGPFFFREPEYIASLRLEGLTEADAEALRALIGERLSVSRAKGGGA